jgi:hypothetical protein
MQRSAQVLSWLQRAARYVLWDFWRVEPLPPRDHRQTRHQPLRFRRVVLWALLALLLLHLTVW